MERRAASIAPNSNILDRPLVKSPTDSVVSLSAFSFLLSEIIQYSQNRFVFVCSYGIERS